MSRHRLIKELVVAKVQGERLSIKSLSDRGLLDKEMLLYLELNDYVLVYPVNGVRSIILTLKGYKHYTGQ